MDIERFFEPLKGATAENLPTILASVQGELKDFIFQEKLSSHNNARTQLFKTFKGQLANLAPDAFDDLDAIKYENMLPVIGEKLKAPKTAPAKTEPTETVEQMRARMQSEFDSNMKTEREKLLFTSAFSEIESAAIAKKLDEPYKGLFRAALQSELDAELSPDSKVLFKTKADGKYFTRDGAHATPSQVAEEMLKRYPRLVAEPVRSPSPLGNGTDKLDPENLGGSRLRAGLSELAAMREG
jgi:hypothetical protein